MELLIILIGWNTMFYTWYILYKFLTSLKVYFDSHDSEDNHQNKKDR